MASNYPTSLDNFSNPSGTDSLNSPSHSLQHSDINDAVEAIEAKLGIGASPAGSATAGQVLTAQGGGTALWADVTGGLTLINTTSFSGATTASVNNVFSSTYKNYFVILFVQECANAGNFAFRLRASNTDSSGSVYNSMCYGTDTAGTIDVKGAGLTSGQFFNTGAGANYEWHATMMFGNPFEARYTQVNTIAVGRRNGGNYASYSGGVQHSLATSYDGFTLLNSSSGNIAGTVSVYGINN